MPDTYLRLSQLTARISDTIQDRFAGKPVWIVAEVTSHSFRPEKRTHFFELVEKDPASGTLLAKIQGKAWGAGSDAVSQFEKTTGQLFASNISVLIAVEVQYHPQYGLQVNLLSIDANFTLGALEQQRRRTLEKLVADNPGIIWKLGDRYYTRNNQYSLTRVLQRVAVISSRTSAGAQDLRQTLLTNNFHYYFNIDEYFAPVQGDEFAAEIIKQLIAIHTSGKQYDAVVITRGGGAQTDFLIFDNYELCRAIARFPIPVITGIGHFHNESIADWMAHTTVKTPTKAAEFIIAHNRAFEEMVLHHQQQIIIRAQRLLHRQKETLLQLTAKLITQPKLTINNEINTVNNIMATVKSGANRIIKNQEQKIVHYQRVMKMMSPVNILQKGFAVIKTSDNKIFTGNKPLPSGEQLSVILATEQLQVTLNQQITKDARDADL